jgi:predicted membrane channel-forming protein YqfA (hemolysin III family)
METILCFVLYCLVELEYAQGILQDVGVSFYRISFVLLLCVSLVMLTTSDVQTYMYLRQSWYCGIYYMYIASSSA